VLTPTELFSRAIATSVEAKLKAKKINLIKIIHESPKAYDINRSSWSLKTLAGAYHKTHGERISISSISEYFTSAGYKFKKAKKVLTSDDPNYRAIVFYSRVDGFNPIQESHFSIRLSWVAIAWKK